jgi:hypothetical protein
VRKLLLLVHLPWHSRDSSTTLPHCVTIHSEKLWRMLRLHRLPRPSYIRVQVAVLKRRKVPEFIIEPRGCPPKYYDTAVFFNDFLEMNTLVTVKVVRPSQWHIQYSIAAQQAPLESKDDNHVFSLHLSSCNLQSLSYPFQG